MIIRLDTEILSEPYTWKIYPQTYRRQQLVGFMVSFVPKLLVTDLVAYTAVGIEGFIPISEERTIDKPVYQLFIEPLFRTQVIYTDSFCKAVGRPEDEQRIKIFFR